MKQSSGKDIDRIRVILALGEGFSFETISQKIYLDDSTARRYLALYQEKGLSVLLDKHYKGRFVNLMQANKKF